MPRTLEERRQHFQKPPLASHPIARLRFLPHNSDELQSLFAYLSEVGFGSVVLELPFGDGSDAERMLERASAAFQTAKSCGISVWLLWELSNLAPSLAATGTEGMEGWWVQGRRWKTGLTPWKMPRFDQPPRLALAVPKLYEGTPHPIDVTDAILKAQPPRQLPLAPEYEVVAWQLPVTSDKSPVASYQSPVTSHLAKLAEKADGCWHGLLIGFSGLVRTRTLKWWAPAFFAAMREAGEDVDDVLRALTFDPSASGSAFRARFWEAFGRAMCALLFEPLKAECGALNISFGFDLSSLQNLTDAVCALGEPTAALKGADVVLAPPQGSALSLSKGLLVKLASSLLAQWGSPKVLACLSADGDCRTELRQAHSALLKGAEGFCVEQFQHHQLPDWVLGFAWRQWSSLKEIRKALNLHLARLSCWIRETSSAANLAVLFPDNALRGGTQICRWRQEAEAVEGALSETCGLLEQTHRNWEFAEGDVLKEATIEDGLCPEPVEGRLMVGASSYKAVLVPHAGGEPSALWDKLSVLMESGGAVLFLGAPPPPDRLSQATLLSRWLHGVARSHQASLQLSSEAGGGKIEVHPVRYELPEGGQAALFDWRRCPDKVEAQLMAHRLLRSAVQPIVETHHDFIRTAARFTEVGNGVPAVPIQRCGRDAAPYHLQCGRDAAPYHLQTPLVLVANESDETLNFKLQIHRPGIVEEWDADTGQVRRLFHYALVGQEFSDEETPSIVVPLTLPPDGVALLCTTPGDQPHIERANFEVTKVEQREGRLAVEGSLVGGVPSATVCSGHRMMVLEGEELPELKPLELNEPSESKAELVQVLPILHWQVSHRHPLMPWLRVKAGTIETGSTLPPELQAKAQELSLDLPLKTIGAEKVWLCLEQNGKQLTHDLTPNQRTGEIHFRFVAPTPDKPTPKAWLVIFQPSAFIHQPSAHSAGSFLERYHISLPDSWADKKLWLHLEQPHQFIALWTEPNGQPKRFCWQTPAFIPLDAVPLKFTLCLQRFFPNFVEMSALTSLLPLTVRLVAEHRVRLVEQEGR